MAVLHPLAHRERSGSHDVDAARRLVLLRGGQDHEWKDRRLQDVEQHHVRILEMDHERVGIGRLVTLDIGQVLGVGTDRLIALHRRLHVGRRHLLARVEPHAAAQLERIGLRIGRYRRLGGEHRTRGVLVVEGHQPFEQVVDHFKLDGARRNVRVERAGPRHRGVGERAAFLALRPQLGRKGAEQAHHADGDGSPGNIASFHRDHPLPLYSRWRSPTRPHGNRQAIASRPSFKKRARLAARRQCREARARGFEREVDIGRRMRRRQEHVVFRMQVDAVLEGFEREALPFGAGRIVVE